MKDIVRISIGYWRVHLRWATWNKIRKIRFSVKVDFWLRFFKTQQITSGKNIIQKITGQGKGSPSPSTPWKIKLFSKDSSSKCDEIRSFLWVWAHLLKKSSMENFCSVPYACTLSSSIVGLLLHLQFYQKCTPRFWKCGWKVNMFGQNHVIINYWLKKG